MSKYMRYIFYSLLLVVCHNAYAQEGTIKDIDGNFYKTVKIGSQVWMAENLRTTHFRDGSPILEIEDSTQWANAANGDSQACAWCYYDNNARNNPTYGKLYNWYAVADPRNICPSGWHVPSNDEWTVLIDYLGGYKVAGGKMKAISVWETANKSADYSSGFTALPAGLRGYIGTFYGLGYYGHFWSSTESYIFRWIALCRELDDGYSGVGCFGEDMMSGLSVRCVGD